MSIDIVPSSVAGFSFIPINFTKEEADNLEQTITNEIKNIKKVYKISSAEQFVDILDVCKAGQEIIIFSNMPKMEWDIISGTCPIRNISWKDRVHKDAGKQSNDNL